MRRDKTLITYSHVYQKNTHRNFKKFRGSFGLELNNDLKIIVGDNEAGKSTIIMTRYNFE